MTTRNLEHLLRPRSVAVFGASNQPDSIGHTVIRNLLAAGFCGTIMPVNPRYKAVAGVLTYPDVAGLPETPDLAIIATPPATVPGLVADLGERGTRAAVVLTAGLERERDGAGRRLDHAMLAAARPYLLRILGPNATGIMIPGVGLNASYVHTAPLGGSLAFVSEAGGLVTAVLDYAASSGIGFSHFISVGSAADVDFGDILDVLGSEPNTSAILLYMESLRNARKFMSAARAAARIKPVLVVKANRSTAHHPATAFHATRLAEPDAVFHAAMRRAGILRVDTIADLFGAVETLGRARPLVGEGLTIVTNGRSPGVVATDALAHGGGRLAKLADATRGQLAEVLPDTWDGENPIDMEENASPDRHVAVLEIVLDDPATDAVLFIHEPVAVVDSEDVARALVEVAAHARRTFLACWLGRQSVGEARRVFAEAGIATYDSPEAAVQAFLQMVGYRRSQHALMQTPTSAPDASVADGARARRLIAAALAEGSQTQTVQGQQAEEILACYGLCFGDAPAVSRPEQLFMGAATDSTFGPVIVFGQGGAAIEAINDFSVALPPLNMVLAERQVLRTRVSRLLVESSTQSAATMSGLCLALVQIAQAVADLPEMVELDLNPVWVTESGVVAAGARMRLAPAAVTGPERLAIRPYPGDLEERVTVLGRPVVLRPIRPEDAPQHTELFNRLSPEDVRYRFFTLMRQLAQSELARFTQIDYDREMAFIASADGPGGRPETLGVVRAVTDPDRVRAEFAVIVRSDLKGRGLGRMLLEKMIRYCRAAGVGRLVSEVLPDNRGMRALARSLGFLECESGDEDTIQLRLELSDPDAGTS
ncbi:MAG: GNAT family N-acetyltransferase [Rhodospirillales bacterium]|nr:GNAT family N-acetyltransferase [Rhodospirillales bacterium]